MEKIYFYLYKITNSINGMIYVGVHKTKNLEDGYFGSGTKLRKDIDDFGKEHFTKEILQHFSTETEMYEAESVIVDENFVQREDTYNNTTGGHGGWTYLNSKRTKEEYIRTGKLVGKYGAIALNEKMKADPIFAKKIKNKISLNITNKLIEYYKSHPGAFTGRNHKEESKLKIGKANSISQSGSKNSNFGHHWMYNKTSKISRSVKKEEVEKYIADGWILGRKIK